MKRTTASIFTLLSVVSLVGCGTDAAPDATGGEALVRQYQCGSCHGGDPLAGASTPVVGTMAYGPNLTPDRETGLGAWTDEQIIRAIRTGVDDEGHELCPAMPRYAQLTDAQAQAIVRYLRDLLAINRTSIESQCSDPDAGDDAGEDASVDSAVEDTAVVDSATPDATADRPTQPDASVADATVDAAVDARADAALDARADATLDARADAATDARTDATLDARADAATDARADAALDARADAVADARADVASDARTDVPPVDGGPLGCHPVINEFQTGVTGRGTNEWVELYNPCATAISLAGWRLGYRAAANTSPLTAMDAAILFTFSTQSMAPGAYLLLAGAGYTGMVDARLASGLGETGGGVALRRADGVVADSVGWGTATNLFVETRACAAPMTTAAPGTSMARTPDGTDTNNNMADFRADTTPTPRAANR